MLLSQTSFRGGTSSGAAKRRPFSGQQTINIKTFSTLCFLGILYYFTVYHCYRVMLQKVLQNLFPQKNARHNISEKLVSAQRVEIMCSNISNTTRTVSSNIQTPRSGYTDLLLYSTEWPFLC